MSVTVRIPTVLRTQTGGLSIVEAEGSTLREVMENLTARYPGLADRLVAEDGTLHRFVNVFVGDEDARYLGGLDAPVPDGTEIAILPAVAGG